MNQDETTPRNDFLIQVRTVCRLLCSNALTVPEVRQHLAAQRLEAVVEAAPGTDEPGLVRLEVPDGLQLTLEDLSGEFGAYRQVPAMHRRRPLKYVFVADNPDQPYVCVLVAEQPRGETAVQAVTVRRDIRL